MLSDSGESAAKYYSDNSKLVKLLLVYNPEVPITGATIIMFIRYKRSYGSVELVLKLLLDENSNLKINNEMLEAAEEIDKIEVLL